MRQKRVFFDIETGGLDSAKHPVVQIAAVAVWAANLEPVGVEDVFGVKVFFDPAFCDPEALTLIGYEPKKWIDAYEPREAIEHWAGFLRQHSTIELTSKRTGSAYNVARLVGHNAASFDGPFLNAWIKRIAEKTFVPAELRVVDTYQAALWHFEGVDIHQHPKSFRLADLCQHFKIPLTGAHDAMADVLATLALARALRGIA